MFYTPPKRNIENVTTQGILDKKLILATSTMINFDKDDPRKIFLSNQDIEFDEMFGADSL